MLEALVVSSRRRGVRHAVRIALLALAPLILACTLIDDPEQCAATEYVVRPSDVVLRPGQRAILSAYRIECGGQREVRLVDVRWSSSNPIGVAVDSLTGELHALLAATAATITARVKASSGEYRTQPGLKATALTTGV